MGLVSLCERQPTTCLAAGGHTRSPGKRRTWGSSYLSQDKQTDTHKAPKAVLGKRWAGECVNRATSPWLSKKAWKRTGRTTTISASRRRGQDTERFTANRCNNSCRTICNIVNKNCKKSRSQPTKRQNDRASALPSQKLSAQHAALSSVLFRKQPCEVA